MASSSWWPLIIGLVYIVLLRIYPPVYYVLCMDGCNVSRVSIQVIQQQQRFFRSYLRFSPMAPRPLLCVTRLLCSENGFDDKGVIGFRERLRTVTSLAIRPPPTPRVGLLPIKEKKRRDGSSTRRVIYTRAGGRNTLVIWTKYLR